MQSGEALIFGMRRAVINVAITLKALSLKVKSRLAACAFTDIFFGLFVEMYDGEGEEVLGGSGLVGSYPMGAVARLLRDDAAARRALSMALLAISTAAEDCHIEVEDELLMKIVSPLKANR